MVTRPARRRSHRRQMPSAGIDTSRRFPSPHARSVRTPRGRAARGDRLPRALVACNGHLCSYFGARRPAGKARRQNTGSFARGATRRWVPERGARMARRDDGAYWVYVTEEQRREARSPRRGRRVGVEEGCPPRELCESSRFQGTRMRSSHGEGTSASSRRAATVRASMPPSAASARPRSRSYGMRGDRLPRRLSRSHGEPQQGPRRSDPFREC